MSRPTSVLVNLAAITTNVQRIKAHVGNSQLCAVVKADGYGHGSVQVAQAALEGGADLLAVALVEEAEVLRDSGITSPILLLSEPTNGDLERARQLDIYLTVYSPERISHAAAVAEKYVDTLGQWKVHLKVDTGMHRVGVDPLEAVSAAQQIVQAPAMQLAGVFSHLANADVDDHPSNDMQLERFQSVLDALSDASVNPGLRHLANSAGALALPSTRFDLVRIGLAMYGLNPMEHSPSPVELMPALTLTSEVSYCTTVGPEEGVSYGHRYTTGAANPSRLAVVPIGYADGVDRNAGLKGASVLIGGVERPIRGAVTMDQLIVDVTEGPPVQRGDEVILIGTQGNTELSAQHWAAVLETIPYEIVCRISIRVPRNYTNIS